MKRKDCKDCEDGKDIEIFAVLVVLAVSSCARLSVSMNTSPSTIGTINSPIGALAIEVRDEHVTRIQLTDKILQSDVDSPVLALCRKQLHEYFARERQSFSLPLAPMGTDFQREVWAAALKIPYGTIFTYAQIARVIGNPQAMRAVGTALGANPIPIIIPCHRVVPSNGGVGEYAWGTKNKKTLLELEGALAEYFSQPVAV